MRLLAGDEFLQGVHVGLLQVPIPLVEAVLPPQEVRQPQEVYHLTIAVYHRGKGSRVPDEKK